MLLCTVHRVVESFCSLGRFKTRRCKLQEHQDEAASLFSQMAEATAAIFRRTCLIRRGRLSGGKAAEERRAVQQPLEKDSSLHSRGRLLLRHLESPDWYPPTLEITNVQS